MGGSQQPQIVERPRSTRDGRRVPCAKLFQESSQRPAAVPQQFQLLGRFGQVHGHGNLVPAREFDDGRQTGRDERCKARAGLKPAVLWQHSPAETRHSGRRCCPDGFGQFHRGGDAIGGRGNQLQECRDLGAARPHRG